LRAVGVAEARVCSLVARFVAKPYPQRAAAMALILDAISKKPPLQNTMDSVKKGVKFGVMLALLFCGWITFVRLIHGEAAFTRYGITFSGTVAVYLFMGASAGALVGGMMPWATSPGRAYLTGLVASIPITFGILFQQEGPPWRWNGSDMGLAVVLSIVAALAIGWRLETRLSTRKE
jgi:hypothetical protein